MHLNHFVGLKENFDYVTSGGVEFMSIQSESFMFDYLLYEESKDECILTACQTTLLRFCIDLSNF